LTPSATAGSRAAPIAAPICRLVLIMPPTKPWSASGMPRLASTVEPRAVPAVPKPISVTTNSSGLQPVAGSRVSTTKPVVVAVAGLGPGETGHGRDSHHDGRDDQG